MRVILGLLLVALLAWRWRNWQRRRAAHRAPPAPPTPPPTEMLACTLCATHVPAPQVVRGANGAPYCCAAHRDHDPS